MPNPEKKIQILPKTLWPIDASHIKEFSEAFAIPEAELTSIEYPWDVLVLLQRKLKEVITESRIDLGVEVSKHAYIEGPVWIEEGAKVLPFSIVIGPAYIGKNTLVGNHTQIRGA
ncbi:MAG: hypothetical protein U9Q63_01350, partial [Patescibacteria group bacterium]|nr:hypothetical protein [Patescibacteria group bacterium]